jgi:DNA-binding transcriptional LysR family regulator
MHLDQLKYFLAVAETSSFTKASERLFISQPSLSVAIQKLEADVGAKLFERGKKIILLTSAGKHFLNKAKTILKEYESVKYELQFNFSNCKILKLGLLQTLPVVSITKLISQFLILHQNVVIEQFSGNIMELSNWLERGEIDLAITVLREHKNTSRSHILFQENYSLAVAENHHLAKKVSVSLAELNTHPYIDRIGCEIRDDLQRLFVTRGIYPPAVYRTGDDEWSKALVATGIGVAVMPSQSSTPGIVHLRFSDLDLVRQVGLFWRPEQRAKVVKIFHAFSISYFLESSLTSLDVKVDLRS